MGLIAPAGTSEAVLAKIHKEVVAVLADGAVVEKLKAQFMVPIANSPAGVQGRPQGGARPLGAHHRRRRHQGGVGGETGPARPQLRNFSRVIRVPRMGVGRASGSERVARALPQMPKARAAAAVEAPAAPGEAPFYIPATGSASRPRRTLKHNDTFAVFDSHGDIGASGGGPDGLFDCDTRYLSHLELMIDGTQPLLLGSAIKDDNLNYYVDLTNPDIYADGRIVLLKDTVHVARTIYLCDGSLRERIALTNHGAEEVQLTLSLAFASDFADLFEVRGIRRKRRGQGWVEVSGAGGVALFYRGLDDAVRETALSFEPAPSLLAESVATYALKLAPGVRQTIFVTASSRGRLPNGPRCPSSRASSRSTRASRPRPAPSPASRPPTAC